MATFTASDPEGVSPIVWSRLTSDTGIQNLAYSLTRALPTGQTMTSMT